jgi:prepilin-type N-terminal cleavage/methylation domain-containing protein
MRRRGFTLVELLVAMALIVFIMMILSHTFLEAQRSFQTLKSIGDMEERLRTAATLLRRDLSADHFEGKRRTSDNAFWDTNHWQGPPREGFIRVFQGASVAEGTDSNGIRVKRAWGDILHMSVKLRGNHQHDFFTANAAPLAGGRSNYFTTPLPPDARYEQGGLYSGQWAEVAYFLWPNGQQAIDAVNGQPATPLYSLFRCQYVVATDNTKLRGGALGPGTWEISCGPPNGGSSFYYTPNDLAANVRPRRRAFQHSSFPEAQRPSPRGPFNPSNPAPWAATLVLADVISFDVETFRRGGTDFADENFESVSNPGWYLGGVRVTLRIWDVKTSRTRQLTVIQDL